jgi:outer membrane protein OmpA-like peptidoglycan-associated protein
MDHFDKSDVRANEMSKIKDIATFMKQNPTYEIGIEGFADPRGTDVYNQALSERRVTEGCFQMNRRVEVFVRPNVVKTSAR